MRVCGHPLTLRVTKAYEIKLSKILSTMSTINKEATMPSESQIISKIEEIVVSCSNWTIGITDDPERRKKEHGNPSHWRNWDAVLETSARNIEKYFLDKGMKGDTGGGTYPHYVYIF